MKKGLLLKELCLIISFFPRRNKNNTQKSLCDVFVHKELKLNNKSKNVFSQAIRIN